MNGRRAGGPPPVCFADIRVGYPDVITSDMRVAAQAVAAAALASVQEPTTHRVRVEDYLVTTAAAAGEAVLISAELFRLITSRQCCPSASGSTFGPWSTQPSHRQG